MSDILRQLHLLHCRHTRVELSLPISLCIYVSVSLSVCLSLSPAPFRTVGSPALIRPTKSTTDDPQAWYSLRRCLREREKEGERERARERVSDILRQLHLLHCRHTRVELSLSVSLSVPLSLSLCLYVSLCLYLSVSVSFRLSLALSLSLSLSRAPFLSFSVYSKVTLLSTAPLESAPKPATSVSSFSALDTERLGVARVTLSHKRGHHVTTQNTCCPTLNFLDVLGRGFPLKRLRGMSLR